MDHFLIQTKLLLTGQQAPFTGESENIARARNVGFTAYGSGAGSVTLQYKSPFFENSWVNFYSFTGLATGYAEPTYLTTPMVEVRAVSSGSGRFWAGLTAQN
jgi:hypothetical protein